MFEAYAANAASVRQFYHRVYGVHYGGKRSVDSELMENGGNGFRLVGEYSVLGHHGRRAADSNIL